MRPSFVLLALVSVGCAPTLAPLGSTICMARPDRAATEQAADAHAPTDGEWLALLVDEQDTRPSCAATLAARELAPIDCDARAEDARPWSPIPPRIAARFHREGDDDLIWVSTHAQEDGSLAGPIAVVRRTALGLEVQAIGRHEGPAQHVELRLLRTQEADILVVEAERPSTFGGTERAARFLARRGGELVPMSLYEPSSGACSAIAEVVLRRDERDALRDGWERRVVRSATLEESEHALLARENLAVREIDPADPRGAPRARHHADAVRRLVPAGSRLRVDRPPLSATPEPTRR